MNDANVVARAGRLEVRLAACAEDIEAAQALRYRVFFEEGDAVPDAASRAVRRDLCRFDAVCDHIVVVDGEAPGAPIVGAYRVLRQEIAQRRFGFYSAAEFDVDALVARHPRLRFLELGRSCIAEGYRNKRAIEALWRGVWAYALRHRIDAMFGCASLPGVDPRAHAAAFTALDLRRAEPEWAASPAAGARVAALGAAVRPSDPRAALRELPPLVKGYLRLGARFAAQAVIDEAFGVTDILVVLRVADIEARYLQHFAPDGAIAA
jgi:putative hemolysin